MFLVEEYQSVSNTAFAELVKTGMFPSKEGEDYSPYGPIFRDLKALSDKGIHVKRFATNWAKIDKEAPAPPSLTDRDRWIFDPLYGREREWEWRRAAIARDKAAQVKNILSANRIVMVYEELSSARRLREALEDLDIRVSFVDAPKLPK
jgi:hypothetical protein